MWGVSAGGGMRCSLAWERGSLQQLPARGVPARVPGHVPCGCPPSLRWMSGRRGGDAQNAAVTRRAPRLVARRARPSRTCRRVPASHCGVRAIRRLRPRARSAARSVAVLLPLPRRRAPGEGTPATIALDAAPEHTLLTSAEVQTAHTSAALPGESFAIVTTGSPTART